MTQAARWFPILIGSAMLASPSLSRPFDASRQASTGRFNLEVQRSNTLKLGKRDFATSSAFAIRTDKYLGGRTNALEIHMYAAPIDARARERLLKNQQDDRDLVGTGAAYFVLLIDKENRLTQANLTVVIPGTTVARTIAYMPADLEKWFSDYRYTDGRLFLKSNGTYVGGADPNDDKLTLSWDVALDVPVVDLVTARR